MTEYFTGQELLNRYTAENQLSTKTPNHMLKVLQKSLIDDSHRRNDKKKYVSMVKRAVWNLLRPFVPGEKSIGTRLYEKTRLDSFA